MRAWQDLALNAEQQKLVNELMRWCGFLLLVLFRVLAWALEQRLVVTASLLRVLGRLLIVDGVVVKWLGFHRSGVITVVDSLGGGAVDVAAGVGLLSLAQ